MDVLRTKFVVTTLILSLGATRAAGGEYRDPAGFSFVYPEGWVPIKGFSQAAEQDLPSEVQSWIKKNSIDLRKVNMILVREGNEDEVGANLNVVVNDQQVPANEASVKQLLKLLRPQYAKVGATVDELEGRVQKLGRNDAIVVEYRIEMPAAAVPLRQRQVYFAGGGKTYIVTCTAGRDRFAEHAPTFDTILASFKVPAPVARGFDVKQVLIAGAIGGVIGGLVGLVKKLTARKIGT